MKRKITLFVLLLLLTTGIRLKAQTILWSENFNSGTSRYFTLNTADVGCALNPRSAWAINNSYTGTNGTVQGSVPCNLTGTSIGVGYNDENTPNEPAGIAGYPNSYYMHIIDTSEAQIGVYCASWIIADNICVQAQNIFARMDTDINTTGLDSVTFKFWWMCYGNSKDVGKVYYSTNGGTTWTQITTPISNYNLTPSWVQQSIYLPAFDNQAQLRFGFMFVSTTGGGTQKDPPFCIDDISIEVPVPPTNTITTGTIAGSPLCACSTVKVPFTSTGSFTAGNTYTAQLSSATGSFATPVTIGTNANDTLHTDTISATIPCNTATGTGYMIRVISSTPAVTGTNNGVNISVNAQVAASVIISANPGNNICAASSVTFTATPAHGGTTPSYQWKVNGGNVGTNSNTFTVDTLSNGDVVTCTMTSNAACVTGSPATSNSLTMTVTAPVPASVNVIAAPSGAICPGTSVLFTATPSGGGATPSYQWKVNGNNVGTNADTFSSATLTNGALVTCIMTSSLTCVSGSPATSNTITMTVNAGSPASVTINALPTGAVCAGTSVSFTATPVNGGTPSYQWKVNGGNVGTNSNTFTVDTLSNGDVVTCVMISNATCVTGSPATSNSVTMTVNTAAPVSVGITALPSGAVCAGSSVSFTAVPVNGGTPSYQWKVNGADVGTNSNTFSSAALTNGALVTCTMTSSLTCVSGSPATSNTITMTVNAASPASVSINALPTGAICPGTSVSFTATPVNGGTPSYQWKVNGGNVGTNSNAFTVDTLSNGDVVTCVMTSNATCVTGSPATSGAITMTVNAGAPASVSITALPTGAVCANTSVSFTAVPVNGGTPSYQWEVNGSNVGTNSNTFSSNTLSNADAVTCVMTSTAACATGSPASSNTITMSVNPSVPASVSISPSPGNNICSGTKVLFTATPSGGGTTPSYQWKVNSIDAGSSKDTFSSSSLTTGDVVTCVMTSNASCVTGSPATSGAITMTVTNSGVAAVTISASPDSVICSGASVTFTATPVSGGTPTYQWKLNGNNAGTNSSTYAPTGLNTGDKISCIMTSSLTCATGSPASSNTVTMTVNPSTAASVSITASTSDTICSGTSVIFTSKPVGGGTTPAYQWKLNGNNVGANSSSYSNSSLANGDNISCVMTSSLTCATGSPATSPAISMTVNTNLPVSVAVAANTPTDTICSGAPVTFTATPSNGGASPSYQWKLNSADVGTNGTTYSNSSLGNGNIVSCYLTSDANCITGSPTSSDSVTMVVNPSPQASVTISSNSGNAICTGTSVTFTATALGGGTPAYQWKLNGTNAGTNSSTYTNSSLANDDNISCVMTSSLTCATGSPATSDTITMNVNNTQAASVSISPNPGNSICSGTSVDFSATPQGGGTPSYQWKLNGGNVGTDASSYSSNSLASSDVVTCVMTSSLSCATGSPATSNAVTMSVVPKAVAGTISSTQNEICTGTLAILNDNGASGGNFQWQSSPDSIAGFNSITGATSSGYTSAPISKSTYYRMVVDNSTCADTSLPYKITVSVPPSATFSGKVNGKVVTFNITASTGVSYYSWDFGDGTSDTLANPTHTYDSVKTYDVCLTVRNASDCNYTTCQDVTTFPTGINEISNLSDWQVYPDPFSNQLYITSGSIKGYVVSVEIYDILGRNVLLKNINGIMDNPLILDVTALKAGVYYLRVTMQEGNFVKPVVKQ